MEYGPAVMRSATVPLGWIIGCPLLGMLSDRIGVMSARPGCFLEIVETGWPADRDSRIVERPELARITGRLWTRLRQESLKAMSEDRLTS